MASLLIGAGFLIKQKIDAKKEAKREIKRKQYEERYNELEKEHSKTQRTPTEKPGADLTGQSRGTDATGTFSEKRRSSSIYSEKSDGDDGPSKWVDEANLVRSKSRT